jgi:hypothetical protein
MSNAGDGLTKQNNESLNGGNLDNDLQQKIGNIGNDEL